MSSLLLMIQFMTRYPIPVQIDFTVDRFVQGMKWMPIVGFLVGLPAAVLLYLCFPYFGGEVSTFLALIVLITVTGGLHLDGMGDSADGLFCYRSKERVLEIMRDSTLGTNGVVAVVLTILLKFITLKNIPLAGSVTALLCAPVLGRMAITWHTTVASYAREQSGMGSFTDRVGLPQALTATVCSLLLTSIVFYFTGMSLVSAIWSLVILHGIAIALAVGFAFYLQHRIGGITGDTIGATIELSEMTSFLFFLLAWDFLV
ncbi:adenosylcobinamide-GDP ribazoletransferase [Desulfogranum marinum]|uniref:adenosylcobinamide-GDP ribazoletransferase n=1 Tax=Desulfogranum marinum TaxID=453220 RepID=UPI00196545DF|nr:adenosylcobinamide-GDP ribazoletransferase [Desulfogranum marinum]MBM9511492.1 adenosylcobinamide-GDP ribazoletransferase [Desulfogranum marinum]